jgi:hypothetical protein
MDLEKIAPILEEILKQSIAEKRYPFGFDKYRGVSNKIASGRLYNSVKVQTAMEPNDVYVLQVIMADYAQFVQSGRLSGKKGVPIEALEKWIKERKLKGRNKEGRYITNRSFAFAIQKNIKKFGIRPSNFIDVSLEKILESPRVMELLGDAAYEDLINAIEGL